MYVCNLLMSLESDHEKMRFGNSQLPLPLFERKLYAENSPHGPILRSIRSLTVSLVYLLEISWCGYGLSDVVHEGQMSLSFATCILWRQSVRAVYSPHRLYTVSVSLAIIVRVSSMSREIKISTLSSVQAPSLLVSMMSIYEGELPVKGLKYKDWKGNSAVARKTNIRRRWLLPSYI